MALSRDFFTITLITNTEGGEDTGENKEKTEHLISLIKNGLCSSKENVLVESVEWEQWEEVMPSNEGEE